MQKINPKIRAGVLLALVLITALALIIFLARRNAGFGNQLSDLTRGTVLHTFFPDHDPLRPDAITSPPFTSLSYGVQAFLWWDNGQVGVSAGTSLDWILMMQFTHVKQTFGWRQIEPNPDEWHWERADAIMDEVEKRNIQMVARLSDIPQWAMPEGVTRSADIVDSPPADLENWREFCQQVAERYQGRIKAYQVWNEPNLAREWGGRSPNAAEYAEFLRICSEAIREADPTAIIISAGLAPTGNMDETAMRDDIYLQQLYDAGFTKSIDVVGAHAPGFSRAAYGPDDAEQDGKQRWQSFRRVEDLRRIMVENGDAQRQMAILEFGYTTDQTNPVYSWFAVTEMQQAWRILGAYNYAAKHWRPWVGLMSLIYIADPSWTPEDEQFWWAINNPQTRIIRPAFGFIAQMEKYCGDIILPERNEEETAGVPDEPNPCN